MKNKVTQFEMSKRKSAERYFNRKNANFEADFKHQRENIYENLNN